MGYTKEKGYMATKQKEEYRTYEPMKNLKHQHATTSHQKTQKA